MNTHPNAFRMEAAELKAEGQRLLDLAKSLDAKADELLGIKPKAETPAKTKATPAPVVPAEATPASKPVAAPDEVA